MKTCMMKFKNCKLTPHASQNKFNNNNSNLSIKLTLNNSNNNKKMN